MQCIDIDELTPSVIMGNVGHCLNTIPHPESPIKLANPPPKSLNRRYCTRRYCKQITEQMGDGFETPNRPKKPYCTKQSVCFFPYEIFKKNAVIGRSRASFAVPEHHRKTVRPMKMLANFHGIHCISHQLLPLIKWILGRNRSPWIHCLLIAGPFVYDSRDRENKIFQNESLRHSRQYNINVSNQ